ncbi:cation-transporting P-type ATPase [Thermoanaerobacterium sp. RBIITD]|uniref:cation-translocating P-type ATPase n=1 Tax=Thermoanaerobacterium sp. RBIITD TaxID=1550240 RepID=UPI000BB71D1B|nr:cation-transporting P-type ATPase [Thermoanaerobacterium sp. RBIITD]SNX55297.1 Ca2+-transporting ATPase [Thermoanaerobacterium sp. RBIITD]
MGTLKDAYSMNCEEVLKSLDTDIKGLSNEEAYKRLKESGLNKITKTRNLSFWDVFFEEVREPMILLLLLVGVIYSLWGNIGDAITIFSIIILLVLVEVFTEYRAKKNIEALNKISSPTTVVIRDNMPVEINTEEIVPGDIMVLRKGEKVAADGRILESSGLEVDEAPLTGESMPVYKENKVLSENIPLHNRSNMVFSGTTVLRGKGLAVAVSTGMDTEIGRIKGLTIAEKQPKTPLQRAMKELSITFAWVAIILSIIIPFIGYLRGMPFHNMFLTGLAMAFAVIPEELPIIVTMVLGIGIYTLSKSNILARKLKAVETLGNVTVIATDKTGTLTKNIMKVSEIYKASDDLFDLAASSTDIIESGVKPIGDPIDIALLSYITKNGAGYNKYQIIKDYGFDDFKKVYTYILSHNGNTVKVIKGAPEYILKISNLENRDEIEYRFNNYVKEGLRVIAFAKSENIDNNDKYTFLGMVAFIDPVRDGVDNAVRECIDAGVKIKMLTGDNLNTAISVANRVSIDSQNSISGENIDASGDLKALVSKNTIFARITPEQKLNIVKALQSCGEIVAVTGDGINDAPALTAADIGISMGQNGTDVAKEASDLVITDDSFPAIVEGIKVGRRLYDNLTKGVRYYLSCKLALVSSFILPLILGLNFPFTPIQIILLELFMDLAASASFTSEPMEIDVMKIKPKKKDEKFLDKAMVTGIIQGAIGLFLAVMTVYLFSFYTTENVMYSQTMAFGTWLIGHVILAIIMRTKRVPLYRVGLFSNIAIDIWAILVVVFFIIVINVPIIRTVLGLTVLTGKDLVLIIISSIAFTIWIDATKFFRKTLY